MACEAEVDTLRAMRAFLVSVSAGLANTRSSVQPLRLDGDGLTLFQGVKGAQPPVFPDITRQNREQRRELFFCGRLLNAGTVARFGRDAVDIVKLGQRGQLAVVNVHDVAHCLAVARSVEVITANFRTVAQERLVDQRRALADAYHGQATMPPGGR